MKLKCDIYKQATYENKNDPIVVKWNKRILLNKILWTVGCGIAFILIFVLAIIGGKKEWKTNIRVISILIPCLVTILLGVMAVMVWIGNIVAVKMYKGHKIIFYSGPGNNVLYVDGKQVGKGSSPQKLSYKFPDGDMVQIYMSTIDFAIECGKNLPQTLKDKQTQEAIKQQEQVKTTSIPYGPKPQKPDNTTSIPYGPKKDPKSNKPQA